MNEETTMDIYFEGTNGIKPGEASHDRLHADARKQCSACVRAPVSATSGFIWVAIFSLIL